LLLVNAQKTRKLPLHLSRLPKLEGAHFDARLKNFGRVIIPPPQQQPGTTK
jgi:hypothetical protein